MADAIHPNNAGHAIIADRIEPALRSALAAASR
jgi:lysophospholipase L1-like esterase